MSLTLRKRRVKLVMPSTRMGRVKAQAIRTAGQVRPAASTAREVAVHRIEDARIWAAPKLDRAAHSVERQIAPKVSAFLTTAAEKIEPSPSIRRRGPWSTILMLAGFAACAVGIVIYRNNARQWTGPTSQTTADAGRWSGERTEETAGGIGRTEESGRSPDETTGRMY